MVHLFDWVRAADLGKADAILSGIYLVPGNHTISFAYRPRLAYAGVLATGLTTGGLALGGFIWLWQKKRISAWRR